MAEISVVAGNVKIFVIDTGAGYAGPMFYGNYGGAGWTGGSFAPTAGLTPEQLAERYAVPPLWTSVARNCSCKRVRSRYEFAPAFDSGNCRVSQCRFLSHDRQR
jgi:hypothetical protein